MEWQVTRTYRLTRNIINRLDRLVEETQIYNSQLVESLLSIALDYVEIGHWEIETRPGRPEMDGIRVR